MFSIFFLEGLTIRRKMEAAFELWVSKKRGKDDDKDNLILIY